MPKTNIIVSELRKLSDAADAGFALAFHIHYTRPTFLFQSYPTAWISEYSEKGLVMSDPTVHWGFENDGFRRWSDLAQQDTHGVLDQAAVHGLRYGVTCAHGGRETRSMCSFAQSDREFTDAECAALLNCVTILHDETATLISLDAALLKDLDGQGITVSQPGGR